MIEPGPGVRHRLARHHPADAGAARDARARRARSPTGAAAAACWRSRPRSSAGRRCWPATSSPSRSRPRARARRPTASTVEVTRCDVRQGGPPAPTVLANLVRPLLLEVAANLTRRPGPPDHLRPGGRRARRGRARVRPPRPASRSRAASGDNWAGDRAHGTRARDHARRRPGRGAAARRGRAPHPGHHRPRARRGHRRRRGSCSRPRTSSASARSSSAAPTTRSPRCAPRSARAASRPSPRATTRRRSALAARLHEMPGRDPDARGRARGQARRDRAATAPRSCRFDRYARRPRGAAGARSSPSAG